jgi:hypothetical protein
MNGGANQACCDEKWKNYPTGVALTSWREDHDSTSGVRKPVEMAYPARNIGVETIYSSGSNRTRAGFNTLGLGLN